MKIILASNSPRRKELLKRIISNFEIKVSNIDESINRPQNVSEIPYELAYRKAKEIAKDHYNDIVIGSDTIVAINNEVLEKPVDEKDAYRMLKLLNNNTHEVISGIAILYQDKEIRYIEKSFVTFNNLTDKEILDYLILCHLLLLLPEIYPSRKCWFSLCSVSTCDVPPEGL